MRLFVRTRTERWAAQSSDRAWSQKESLRHQEEKYAVRHHCIIRAVKLPRVRIDVIIDPLRGERVLRASTREQHSTKLQRKVKTFPGALTALARSKERNVASISSPAIFER